MRGSRGLLALCLAVSTVACNTGKPRVLRPPSVQQYDLPPDVAHFRNPPEYPEDSSPLQKQTKTPLNMQSGGGGMGGGGGAMPGAGGMGGAGMGGAGGMSPR